MQSPGWILVVMGLVLIAVGAIWILSPTIPWLGRLPGDIRMEGKHFRLYFPVATCVLISVMLTAILWLVRYFSR